MTNTLPPETHWKPWQKMLFRYGFVFLSLMSLIAYNPLMQALDLRWATQTAFFGHLHGCAAWLDDHVFHLGYLPAVHAPEISDTHFGVILTLTIAILSIVIALAWSFFDKERSNYNRLYFWFCNYLAYYIFLAMIPYAVEKIIPVQAHYPNATELMSRLGSFRRWEFLFLFMGASPAYCMFCGWLEFIGSALLLFNRTRVLGGLLMIIALVQVVCLNIFYNNNVILLSAMLLLCTLFIMARAMPKLYRILVGLQPVSLAEYRYSFTTPWKKYALVLLCFLPVWKLYAITTKSWKYYCTLVREQQTQRLYTVASFGGQNGAMPSADSIRWKYVVLFDHHPRPGTLIKYDMQEKTESYIYSWDTLKTTLAVYTKKDTLHKNVFTYSRSVNGNLQLKGFWQGKAIAMELKNMPVDSMTLVKDTFLFMQEDQ
ncbi:hypothetical protein BEL04_21315 [Mucilaginibacter sp. PPCGB 2223]|uniref:hypothetical protein n=1 Tax=Mucilaginibacter sp. PPCGB 2223 TaxID=1886027 RepID=UPI0008254F59|nr:hypothetical protein [Mucilaginibacter sp. PPCGB 2223]OCX50330.1 hypothetical protein BEL04_21315 [Mucilaginibacter sp. PPCGB 2223]